MYRQSQHSFIRLLLEIYTAFFLSFLAIRMSIYTKG